MEFPPFDKGGLGGILKQHLLCPLFELAPYGVARSGSEWIIPVAVPWKMMGVVIIIVEMAA